MQAQQVNYNYLPESQVTSLPPIATASPSPQLLVNQATAPGYQMGQPQMMHYGDDTNHISEEKPEELQNVSNQGLMQQQQQQQQPPQMMNNPVLTDMAQHFLRKRTGF